MTTLGWWAVLLAAVLSFAEAIVGVGLVLPGETALTALAAASSRDKLPVMVLCATLGASAGDHVNYALGRRFGDRLPRSRLVRRIGVRRWERGAELMRTHGGRSLVLARLVPVVRTVTPAAAGIVRLRYRSFLAASLAGSLLWSALWVLAGTFLARLLHGHPYLAAAGGVVLVIMVLLVRAARRRHAVAPEVCAPGTTAAVGANRRQMAARPPSAE